MELSIDPMNDDLFPEAHFKLPTQCGECKVITTGEHDQELHDKMIYQQLQAQFEQFFTSHPSDHDKRNKSY